MSRLLGEDTVVIQEDRGANVAFHADLTQDREVLALGEKATVHGIILSNGSNQAVEVTAINSVGSTKFSGAVGSRGAEPFEVRFTTSGGLTFQSLPNPQGQDVKLTVFYAPL